MKVHPATARLLAGLAALLVAGPAVAGPAAAPSAAPSRPAAPSAEIAALIDYVRSRNSTGFIVVRHGRVLVSEAWPPSADDPVFANFVYGRTADGALLEDVASLQKSVVALLVAIAVDKALIDAEAPVSASLGAGWSRATPAEEAGIRVVDLLTMSSGLDEQFRRVAPPGAVFLYNTPVYAVAQRLLETAAGRPLDALTRDWLTGPLGMADTDWRRRPAALASVGNAAALVTTPQDLARLGLMVLHGGVAADGTRVVSEAGLQALFVRSSANPAYGRLWWLNGGDHLVRAGAGRVEGPLIPAAPADLVAALGAFDRRLYVAPSLDLVVVRTGAAAADPAFDQQLWLRLMRALQTSGPWPAESGARDGSPR